jgi:hypothetical protein
LQLAGALNSSDAESGASPFLKILAELGAEASRGKSVGLAIQAILTRDGIPADSQDRLRACLLSNWRIANDFGLITPDNLERMRAGSLPVISVGSFRGKEAILVATSADNGPAGKGLTLVPGPLRKNFTEQSAGPASMAGRQPNRLPPAIPVTPGQSSGAAQAGRLSVSVAEVAAGEPVKADSRLVGTEELYVNSADESKGIVYALVDPAKMTVDRHMSNGQLVIKRIPNTKTSTAPWVLVPIPGTSEKGVFLTTFKTVSYYYVGEGDSVSTRYRIFTVSIASP